MSCSGNTYEEILNVLVPAMRSFKKITRRLKLKLSPKAVLVISSPKLIKFPTNELASYKLLFKTNKHTRDLGVSHTCGKLRPNNSLADRTTKSKSRLNKYLNLPNQTEMPETYLQVCISDGRVGPSSSSHLRFKNS